MDDVDSQQSQRVWQILICGVAILLGLIPIFRGSTWWTVCRGRAVIEYNLSSSALFIQRDDLADSDCLAGIVSWLCFDILGINGLMLLKLGTALFVSSTLSVYCRRWFDVLVAVTLVIVTSTAFEPGSVAVDLIGMLIAWKLAAARRTFALSVLAMIWCNLSIGAIWCLPVTVVACSTVRVTRQNLTWMICSVLVALCLNPRGPLAIVEMTRTAVPAAFYNYGLLSHTQFSLAGFTIPTLLTGLLWVLAISRSPRGIVPRMMLVAIAACGIINRTTLVHAAMIAGLTLLTENAAGRGAEDDPRGPGNKSRQRQSGRKLLNYGTAFAVLAAIGLIISGGLNGHRERLGWGVADTLDYRLMERDLQNHQGASLLAHCTDTSSAGMLLLVHPEARVLDIVDVAIKRGRFEELEMLNCDLSFGRKKSYARVDGGTGGWWDPLINGEVDIVVASSRRTQIIKALEPTLWKPLALDSPAIVFGKAGSRKFTGQILSVQNQRELVNFGPWQHQLLAQNPNRLHTDLWQTLTGQKDCRADLRQAAVFRAMGMLNGAVRTLLPVLSSNCRPDAGPEFLKVQSEFGWQESLQLGRASQWRMNVIATLRGTLPEEQFDSLSSENPGASDSAEFSPKAINSYCSGRPELAIKLIKENDPDSLFARHSIHWQTGDLKLADQTLKQLQTEHTDHPLILAAEFERGIHRPQ